MKWWRLTLVPVVALLIGVVLADELGGVRAALAVPVLALLEVALSFDNAVMNATVLRRLSPMWQGLFMTLGLLIAVIGVRLVLPVVIVAITSGLSLGHVVTLALHQPALYAAKLVLARPLIVAFGAVFLLMIFLDFVLDASKNVYWLAAIERPLGRLGKIRPLSALIALSALSLIVKAWPGAASVRAELIVAGISGLTAYLGVRLLRWLLESWQGVAPQPHERTNRLVPAVGRAALGLFIYLEVLDATFSFDSVVGAFAVTTNVVVIAIGLGIGALVVRQLTVLLVRGGAFANLIYLEHGAHYAVGAVAVLLGISLIYNLPAAITGGVSAAIIGLAVASSLRYRRRNIASGEVK